MGTLEKAFLEEQRRVGNFLPKYSDYYFEKKIRAYKICAVFFGYLALILTVCILFGAYTVAGVFAWDVLFIIGLIYCLKGNQIVNNYRKKVGYLIQPDMIVRVKNFNQPVGDISYEELDHEIKEGAIHYGNTALRLGRGRNKITFSYEIGYAAAKTQVKKCHKELQKHLPSKLPPFENKGLGLLDRRYCYKKGMKNQVISLLLAMLFSRWIVCPKETVSYAGLAIMMLIYGIWEYFSIYFLYKNAVLYQKNQKSLRLMFEEYPMLKFGNEYMGYAIFGFMAAALLLCNMSMLF